MSLVNYPTIRPSLILDFQKAEVVDPRVTFTRASTATFFDSAGVLTSAAVDVARLDYNPSTLAPQGLLIEEQRTNAHTYSEDLSAAAWNKARVTITTDAIVAPSGALTGDKVVENTDNNTHIIQLQDALVSLTSGTTYTYSVFAKAGERNFLKVEFGADFLTFSTSSATFNLTTGTIDATSGSGGTFTITSVGDGWYRLTATATAAANAVGVIRMFLLLNVSTSFYTGDGTSGLYIWGGQQEAGAFPTSYIPTTTIALTRSADVASMTGTNFSSWFNASEGTLVTQSLTTRQISNAGTGLASIDDGTINNMIRNFVSATAFGRFVVFNSGVTQADLIPGIAITANTILKLANAYALNNFASVSNGSAAQTDSSGTIPTVNRMTIGFDLNGVYLNGTIQRIAYYPTRLANAQLQALTS